VQLGRDFANAPAAFRQSELAEIQEKLDAIDARLLDTVKVDVFEGVIGAKNVGEALGSKDLGH
jgi:hypothetical protein